MLRSAEPVAPGLGSLADERAGPADPTDILPAAEASSLETSPAGAPTSVLPAAATTSTLPEAGGPIPPERRPPRSRALGWVLVAGLVLLLALTVVLAHAFGGGSKQPPASPSPSAPVSPTVKVPPVVGLPIEDAKRMITDVGLTVGAVKPVPGTPGRVVAVHPGAGSPVSSGATVTLDVGAQPKHKKDEHGHHGKNEGGGGD